MTQVLLPIDHLDFNRFDPAFLLHSLLSLLHTFIKAEAHQVYPLIFPLLLLLAFSEFSLYFLHFFFYFLFCLGTGWLMFWEVVINHTRNHIESDGFLAFNRLKLSSLFINVFVILCLVLLDDHVQLCLLDHIDFQVLGRCGMLLNLGLFHSRDFDCFDCWFQ